MKLAAAICFSWLLLGVPSVWAADPKTDEAAIRAAIANEHPKTTDDVIFWSGAYKRPRIGQEKGEQLPGAKIGARRNEKTTTDVQRIEVAASGDLAYEFSYGTVDYDLPGPLQQHVGFKVGLLRVWKKIDGGWKVAAVFIRPIE